MEKMRWKICITIFLLVHLFSCSRKKEPVSKTSEKIRITFEIIPEDYDRNLYYVEWKDTLRFPQGDGVLEEPKEIWCVVTSKSNDTLGYYKGLSMAQTFAYFQPDDSVVILNFMIGIDFFSDVLKTDRERTEYVESGKYPVEFEPIEINIYTDLRKKLEKELKGKE